jgi:hypothetical protein
MMKPAELSQKRKASQGFGLNIAPSSSIMPAPYMSYSPTRPGSVKPNQTNDGESMAFLTLREEILCSSTLA